ncbi:glycosyltransferase family 4 protein [Gaoshiqia sediminis]|uniref:Glycosyltransferase family 4 protein n=1 Tax=Gaoshiqia sediminis TaxID=2986998 RepID=A0AA42C9W7_9BACT|nr:glycosyltransferase family 4 protein [Gaoshiqia sediminis]MCW0482690.1 glycosyltransferase family 4 protein [Gaoshiqia sediminis]
MKKILIITYYWPPSGGAGVQRWLKFTKYLPGFGVQPVVLTVDPAQASYPQRDESLLHEVSPQTEVHRTPTFELYNLYLRLTGKKEIPYGGFANEGKETFLQRLAKMVRGNFFIPDPRKGWNRYAFRKAAELIRKHGIDTVVTTSPPHSTQLIGLRLKRKLGVRWVADMRDPWTDIYYYRQLYHSALARKIDRNLELKVLQQADQLVVVSNDVKRIFSEKGGAAVQQKIQVIPNGYDEEDFEQEAPGGTDKFVITYTGTIAASYRLDGFLAALASLPAKLQEKTVLRFVGKIPPLILEQVRQAVPHVEIDLTGYVDHRKSVAYLLQASVQLLIIPQVKNNLGIVPGKFFEYLASGKPVLALGPKGSDLAKLIGETGCGALFEYDDSDAIAHFLREGLDGKLTGGKRETARHYSRKALTQRMSELMNSK